MAVGVGVGATGTDRLNCGGATACGATTYYKTTTVKQRSSRSLVIYVVLRPRSPAISAWIVDPYLLVYRQTQAAYHPQFIVEDKPVIALACARPLLALRRWYATR